MASFYADLGYFGKDILKNSWSIDSILNGHPGPLLPGIHVSTGPLGQGLSASTGLSIAGKKIPSFDVYCILGDGEIQEGIIWEAVMYAGYKKLDNLCVIIDANEGQLDDVSTLIIDEGDVGKPLNPLAGASMMWMAPSICRCMRHYAASNTAAGTGAQPLLSAGPKRFWRFFDAITGHKVTLSDEVVNLEIQLHEKERNQRIDDLKAYLHELLKYSCGNEVFGILCEYAKKMNLQLETDDSGFSSNAVKVSMVEPSVKTKEAPVRDKKIKYDAGKLPVLEKGKTYKLTDVVSNVMSALAADPRVISIDADLASTSGLLKGVQSVDSTRGFNVGIAEANMMGIGEGFAVLGNNVWVSTFCPFFELRVLRRIAIGYQERMEAIEAKDGWLTEGHNLDITFVATASNLDTQTNGATHMGNDDIMLIDSIGHMKIIDICCPQQLAAVMKWIAEGNKGLVYLRVMRGTGTALYDSGYTFEYNKGYEVRPCDGAEAVIISSGRGVHEACLTSDILAERGIKAGVIDMPSIDEELLLNLYEKNIPLIFAEQNNGYIWNSFMKILFSRKKDISTDNLIPINALDKNGRPQFIHSGTYEELVKPLSGRQQPG